jgi:hypothetical protein
VNQRLNKMANDTFKAFNESKGVKLNSMVGLNFNRNKDLFDPSTMSNQSLKYLSSMHNDVAKAKMVGSMQIIKTILNE